MQNAGNADASGCKINTDLTSDTNTCTITGLNENTSYNVFCTAVDAYYGWPTHMLYTDGAPITYLATSTTGETTVAEDDDDSALTITSNLSCLLSPSPSPHDS